MLITTTRVRFWFAASCTVSLLCGLAVAQEGTASNSSNSAMHLADPAANHSVPPAYRDETYIIGIDDVLAISVWKEPEVSKTVPVRSDGKISLPLAGEVQASGETPRQLEVALSRRLANFISQPEVTVIVEESKSRKFNILGQVAKPGAYPISNSPTVLDAIALAGGFRDFAKQTKIYVLRRNPDGTEARLPFNYKDIIKGKNVEQNVKLQANDTIVVP
ncbi:MAG TPA: polysaccharide biosynthesis/export family protein [Terriglobales bacterium]|nr:polysaccharide biosynthesis/export family protein [Terriglobales bacterium]